MTHHLIPDPRHRRTARRRALAYLVGSLTLVAYLWLIVTIRTGTAPPALAWTVTALCAAAHSGCWDYLVRTWRR